jgi:hypothetical protein
MEHWSWDTRRRRRKKAGKKLMSTTKTRVLIFDGSLLDKKHCVLFARSVILESETTHNVFDRTQLRLRRVCSDLCDFLCERYVPK